jgi:hypothetical protein
VLMMTAVMRSTIDTGNSKNVQSAFENEKNMTYIGNLRELLCFVLKCFITSLFGISIFLYFNSVVFSKTNKCRIKN